MTRHPNERDVTDTDTLPRGPRNVAKTVDATVWHVRWVASASDDGDVTSIGVTFRCDERHGWGVWFDGKFAAAFVYPGTVALSAAELKRLLSAV